MTDLLTLKLFYPTLFITIGVILVVLICSAKSVMINFKGQDSENFRLSDTTTKMKDMHSEVVKAEFTEAHEKEIHSLEVKTHSLELKTDRMEELINGIRDDLDLLMKEYRKTH